MPTTFNTKSLEGIFAARIINFTVDNKWSGICVVKTITILGHKGYFIKYEN